MKALEDRLKEIEKEAEIIKKELSKKEKPQMLKGFNFNPLQKTCKGIIDSIENGTDREDDADHVYEVVLETFYGRDIWKWINSRY